MVFTIIWEMFHRRISLNSVFLLLLVNFASGFRLEFIYIYIPYCKYKFKPHLSSWISAGCAAAIVHRNHFFFFVRTEWIFWTEQASNHCKRFFKDNKLAYANKTKQSITSQNLGSQNFWRIAISVLNKGKSVIPPLFNGPEVLSSASDKAKLFAKAFLRTQILMTQVSLHLFSLQELISNCITFLELPAWLKGS